MLYEVITEYVLKALILAEAGRYLVVEVQAFKQLAKIYELQGRFT